mmetsp:Transcript_2277/g.6513  ORF Transcript_2277/g.6513 Transcript_2277/m.6513 type:complete len:235 (-) Transcript_2277:1365-2069(-)
MQDLTTTHAGVHWPGGMCSNLALSGPQLCPWPDGVPGTDEGLDWDAWLPWLASGGARHRPPVASRPQRAAERGRAPAPLLGCTCWLPSVRQTRRCPMASTTSRMYCLRTRPPAVAGTGAAGARSAKQTCRQPVASRCSEAFRPSAFGSRRRPGQPATGPKTATESERALRLTPPSGVAGTAGLSERLLSREAERDGRGLGTTNSGLPSPGAAPFSWHSEARHSAATWRSGLHRP